MRVAEWGVPFSDEALAKNTWASSSAQCCGASMPRVSPIRNIPLPTPPSLHREDHDASTFQHALLLLYATRADGSAHPILPHHASFPLSKPAVTPRTVPCGASAGS